MDFPAFTAEDVSPFTDSLPLPCLPGTADSHLAFSSLLTVGLLGQTAEHRTWPPPEQAKHDSATWTSTPSSNTGPPLARRRSSEPVAYTPYDFFGGAGTSSGLVYPANDEFLPTSANFPNGLDGINESDDHGQRQGWPSYNGGYKRRRTSEQASHESAFWPYTVSPSAQLSASRPGETPIHPLKTRLCDIQETDWPPPLLSPEAELPLPTPPQRAPAAPPVSSWRSPRSHAQGLHLPILPPTPTYEYEEAKEVEQVEQVTPFISKLCYLLQHKQYEPWIRWDSSGRYLLVAHTKPHLLVILEKFFRHTVISSFIRQLNIYGFRRASTAILLGVLDQTNYTTSAAVPGRDEPETFSASDFSAFHTAGFFRSEPGGPPCRLGALKPIAKERPACKRSNRAKTSGAPARIAPPRRKSSSSSAAASRKRSLASSDSEYEE
ncbi:hypothetical protein RHOSPDRAFT_33361 [Rhodotorula sp. JG-1b]|nr:hypothetical protein RHOSPDRAFT_33361 [Rhodotorula sp. JG-1b]